MKEQLVVRTENRAGELVAALYHPEDTEYTSARMVVSHDEWEAAGSPKNVEAEITLRSLDEPDPEETPDG